MGREEQAGRGAPRPTDDAMATVIGPDAALERLWTGAEWVEGPVYLPDEDAVLFSDIPNDRVLRWTREGGVVEHQAPAAFQNGHTLDLQGRVISCEHGGRRVTRTEADGRLTVIADRFDGRRLNSPNDVVVKSDGTIWFTDPPYGIVSDREGHRADSELGVNHVFCCDPATGEIASVCDAVEEPNGLAFSPDESLLYISDTSAALRDDGTGHHHIVVCDVLDGDRLGPPVVFAQVSPGLADGFRVDESGHLFTSSGDGVHVYAPDGTRIGHVPVPEVVSNCTFGGPDGSTLFITAGRSLYAISTLVRGAGGRHARAGRT